MQRSSSIPRDIRKRPRPGLDTYNAARLMLQLQALDKLLDNLDLHSDKDAYLDDFADPDDKEVKKALERDRKAHEFHAFLQPPNIRRPDGIITSYLDAYKAALHGQTYFNRSIILDFVKGRECTCSEALKDVPKIDRWLGTRLARRFDDVYARVKPFQFLEMPAELRLEVYNALLPPRPYFVIGWSDFAGRPLAEKTLFQTCRKVRNEATNNFYGNAVLYMRLRIDGIQDFLTSDLLSAYSTIEQMGSHNRQIFKTLEIQVDLPYHPNPFFLRDDSVQEDRFASILAVLPNLETVVFLFGIEGLWVPSSLPKDYEEELLQNSLEYFLSRIPPSVAIKWDFRHAEQTETKGLVGELMRDRGGLQQVQSIAAPLIEQRRQNRAANIDITPYVHLA